MNLNHVKNKDYTAVILAAGEGMRLRPLTSERPKCLIEVKGISILERQIATLRKCGITNIVVVGGYLHEKLPTQGLIKVVNEDYPNSNMVYSLFCADSYLKGNIIIGYGDIFYSSITLQKLLDSTFDIAVASDMEWEGYWRQRFSNPLSDAESFRIDSVNSKVLGLGQKTTSFEDIQGQFIGLIKLSQKGQYELRRIYKTCEKNHVCNKNAWESGRSLKKAFMTDILNVLAKQNLLYYEPIRRGWFEIDDVHDLEIAEKNLDF